MQDAYASYEVVVDSPSADLGTLFRFQRFASDGVSVLQSATGIGTFNTRSMRFMNNTASKIENQYLAVRLAACGASCGTDDVYRIRMIETTAAIPRFNNSGSSLTTVLLQNTSDTAISATLFYWSSSGALLASQSATLPARGMVVVMTSTNASLVGQTGSITITHNGRYGDLAGKSVAMEPATGFSFDTPLVYQPH